MNSHASHATARQKVPGQKDNQHGDENPELARMRAMRKVAMSQALRMPIMDFRVHLALGERATPELHSRVAVLEWSAAGAWDIVHDSDWKGRSQ